MDAKNRKFLMENLKKIDVVLEEEKIQQFMTYYEILVEWNKVMNLTGIIDFEEVVIKHFVDSLSLIKVINLKEVQSVIDIGTGAGFPGIPLKIVYPDLKVILLDSLNKRIKFLDTVIESLKLSKIRCIHGRAEDFSRQIEYREQFDLCVSRAVANLASLSEYCIPYIKKSGMFISYKSGKIESELEESKKAVKVLGGKIDKNVKFCLPDTDMERTLVVIKKVRNTSKKFPRKAGIPSKEPIK
jgi:16S rRNA (guanine(527)-N(7))-methyltransferase GidB